MATKAEELRKFAIRLENDWHWEDDDSCTVITQHLRSAAENFDEVLRVCGPIADKYRAAARANLLHEASVPLAALGDVALLVRRLTGEL